MKAKPEKLPVFTLIIEKEKPIEVPGEKINEVIRNEKRRFVVKNNKGERILTKSFKG